jgi:tetratricopeptide (TPR) repeat protein
MLAYVILNFQVCRQRLGQHALAENLFDEAVQIRRQTLGRDHLEVAASLSKLGAAQIALRKFDDAYYNLRSSLKIARHNLGPIHKTVAQMLCHMACLFYESGEMLSAQSSFEDALDIYRVVWKRELDRDSCMMQLTDTICNIGSIQNRRKCFTDAVSSFSEALDLQRGIVGHSDTRIVSTLDNLGYAYSKKKEYASALSCYQAMLRAQLSNNDNIFNKACLDTFRKEILMYEKLKRYIEAIAAINEALQKLKGAFPRNDSLMAEMIAIRDDVQKKLRLR